MKNPEDIYDVSVKLKHPIGLQLRITTWENDADDFSTQLISGLTNADVVFYLSLATLFRSRNHRPIPGIGNQSVSSHDLLEIVNDALAKHPDISQETKDTWSSEEEVLFEDEVYDLFAEHILGYPVQIEERNFCRVFEKFEVFEIRWPIENVTEKFKQK